MHDPLHLPPAIPTRIEMLAGPPGRWTAGVRDLPAAGPQGPMVSCLMVTRGRPQMARTAVRCWQAQTWTNRELVIVEQGADPGFAQWIAALGDARIRHHTVPEGSMVLGAQRNESLRLARGDFVTVWDDDDLHHPWRVEVQVRATLAADADAGLLTATLVWWPQRGWLGVLRPRATENTLLCRREAMPDYPPWPRGSDTPVVRQLLAQRPVALARAPALYAYVVHPANTWGENHFEAMFHWASHVWAGPWAQRRLARMAGWPGLGDDARLAGALEAPPPLTWAGMRLCARAAQRRWRDRTDGLHRVRADD